MRSIFTINMWIYTWKVCNPEPNLSWTISKFAIFYGFVLKYMLNKLEEMSEICLFYVLPKLRVVTKLLWCPICPFPSNMSVVILQLEHYTLV